MQESKSWLVAHVLRYLSGSTADLYHKNLYEKKCGTPEVIIIIVMKMTVLQCGNAFRKYRWNGKQVDLDETAPLRAV